MQSDILSNYAEDIIRPFLGDIHGEWSIEFDDLNTIGFDLDIENSTLILNTYGLNISVAMQSNYYRPKIQLAMIEALRMIRHVEWLDGTLEKYNPKDIIHIGRICVADTQVHKIKTAWHVKCEGDESLWKHILCDDLSDMALAFIKGLENGLSESQSMALAFNAWFSGFERVRDCDHDALNLMDNMLVEGSKFGSKTIKPYIVRCLTFINGVDESYLDKSHQDDIVADGYYTSVKDSINQSHLSQIIDDVNGTHVGDVVFQDAGLASRFAVCE